MKVASDEFDGRDVLHQCKLPRVDHTMFWNAQASQMMGSQASLGTHKLQAYLLEQPAQSPLGYSAHGR
jgi:hypothetical protein